MSVTTFNYTGADQTYVVPAGVTFITIDAYGAAGMPGGTSGGLGGHAKGQYVVTPGTTLYLHTGGMGNSGYVGGWPGGGNGGDGYTQRGGGGGGYSDVRTGSNTGPQLLVAGGGGAGGGGGSAGSGGDGGGTPGQDGGVASDIHAGAGAGGAPPGAVVSNGAFGQGGPGAGDSDGLAYFGGGGGGGGYYGGGGGFHSGTGGGGGGGGGEGYLDGVLFNASMQSGVRSGNGQIVITAVNTAPLAPTPVLPYANAYIFANQDNLLTWAFHDNDPGDSQLNADVRWRQGAGAWNVISAAAGSWTSYLLPANTWTAGLQYEVQYLTRDANGLASPWSASRFLNVITSAPAPTITSPVSGANLTTSPVTVSWTLPAGYSQDAYLVQRGSASDGSGTTYYSSGTVLGSGLSASVPLDNVMGRTDWIRVSFRSNGHWSVTASVDVVTQLSPPMTPIVTAFQP